MGGEVVSRRAWAVAGLFWLAAGGYFVVASIGGSKIAPLSALVCGVCAGMYLRELGR